MDNIDRERDEIKAYLPAYQKEEWVEHAEQLGMTQSQYVKTMVQAGRRVYEQKNPRIANGETVERTLTQFTDETGDEEDE